MTAYKKCPRCKQEFPRTARYFVREKRATDGFGLCKNCNNVANASGRGNAPYREERDPDWAASKRYTEGRYGSGRYEPALERELDETSDTRW